MRSARLGGRAQGRHAMPANDQEAEYTRARTTDVARYSEVIRLQSYAIKENFHARSATHFAAPR